jgi:histone H4
MVLNTRTSGNSITHGLRNSKLDKSTKAFLSSGPMPMSGSSSQSPPKRRQQGTGLGGAKRHRKKTGSERENISSASIRRLARKGGVKRMSGHVYPAIREVIDDFITTIVSDAFLYTELARRKTITSMDIVQSLRRHGKPIYGFN